MELTKREEAEILKKYEPYVQKCVRKMMPRNSDHEAAAQEGRIGIALAARKWDPELRSPLQVHIMNRIRWNVFAYAKKCFHYKKPLERGHSNKGGDENSHEVESTVPDLGACNAERALLAVEEFEELSELQQEQALEELYGTRKKGKGRGTSSADGERFYAQFKSGRSMYAIARETGLTYGAVRWAIRQAQAAADRLS